MGDPEGHGTDGPRTNRGRRLLLAETTGEGMGKAANSKCERALAMNV